MTIKNSNLVGWAAVIGSIAALITSVSTAVSSCNHGDQIKAIETKHNTLAANMDVKHRDLESMVYQNAGRIDGVSAKLNVVDYTVAGMVAEKGAPAPLPAPKGENIMMAPRPKQLKAVKGPEKEIP